MNKAIFLDRDGVLCDAIVKDGKPCSARSIHDLTVWPETIEGCAKLKAAGFKLFCFSNQPDIARGFLSYEEIIEQNRIIAAMCDLDAMLTCPHDNEHNCACRKPKPGMIYALAVCHTIDLAQSYVIGDRWSDIESGAKAGIPHDQLYFIDYNYKDKYPAISGFRIRDNFVQCVNSILGRESNEF